MAMRAAAERKQQNGACANAGNKMHDAGNVMQQ
jgi:hypothetical protein